MLKEKYIAWLKYHDKYTAEQVLKEILADLDYTQEQHDSKALNIADVSNWVAIANRLPEKGDKCWLNLKDKKIVMDMCDGDGFVDHPIDDITHWMLINEPKPPCC